MSDIDVSALAREMWSAYDTGDRIPVPPSARYQGFDLKSAYAVEAEVSRLRKQIGRRTVGLKVGYANKAVWRALKLDTLVWASMYDDTVHYAGAGPATLSLPYYRSPRIEPEIVFHVKRPVDAGLDAAGALDCVDWFAIGFEIIDCPYPEWQFKPPDFVASLGLHLALVVGKPHALEPQAAADLVNKLANFKLRVSKDGQFVEEGAGRNALRNPALCLAELAGAVIRQSGTASLSAGDHVSTGTLTSGHPIARGETWEVQVDSLQIDPLTLRLT